MYFIFIIYHIDIYKLLYRYLTIHFKIRINVMIITNIYVHINIIKKFIKK